MPSWAFRKSDPAELKLCLAFLPGNMAYCGNACNTTNIAHLMKTVQLTLDTVQSKHMYQTCYAHTMCISCIESHYDTFNLREEKLHLSSVHSWYTGGGTVVVHWYRGI